MIQRKKNYHIAKKIDLPRIQKMIKKYSKKYPTPKYMSFIRILLERGFKVKIYVARVSKYVFVEGCGEVVKIRFSNHKPIFYKEKEQDCDHYVGISNFQTSTTDEIIKKILNLNY